MFPTVTLPLLRNAEAAAMLRRRSSSRSPKGAHSRGKGAAAYLLLPIGKIVLSRFARCWRVEISFVRIGDEILTN